MFDFNTYLCQHNAETLEWCSSIMEDNTHYTYRPLVETLSTQHRAHHAVMHHRAHQLEY